MVLEKLGLQRGGRWLFRGLDLTVRRGTFVAVVGPSGVGKSSLLHCLAGMLPATEGHARYLCSSGHAHEPRAYRSRLGIVFQNLRLVSHSTLINNVLTGRLGRYPWWKTLVRFPRHDREAAAQTLEKVGLSRLAGRWVTEVSGGEQQRTAVARALFQEPELILADEPVSNLDPANARLVLGLLRDECHRSGRTVVCVLHDHACVDLFADAVLHLGDKRARLEPRLVRS